MNKDGGAKMATRQSPVVCDINITPLIDVMLVLLVTLIVSLPMMTHAVKLDMPNGPPAQDVTPPEVIDLEIDFDGTVAWDGRTVKGLQDLERDLRSAARKNPQPEIHLHADRHVKYNFVAVVLAAAQRSGVQKMGFADTGEFSN
jgi:biopolymer transport protein ExbD